MTAEEHLLLNEVIERQFGLSFAPAKKEFLESRLRPRLASLHLRRFIDYYLLLQYDLNGELEHLARLITNNETYFFREVYQFEGLFTDGLAELRKTGAASGANGELRMLCAGCSSGEEPYTLNIYAREASARAPLRWSTHAFDIDVDRLRMAKEAVYGVGSMRSTTEEQKAQYFSAFAADRWQLRRSFREGVEFHYGNILDVGSFQKTQPYDVVFCRNVLIYFGPSLRDRVLGVLQMGLRRGGFLCLGANESLPATFGGVFSTFAGNERIYRLRGEA